MSVEVYVRSEIPQDTTLIMYVMEDTTGDGSTDNQVQESINGGDQFFVYDSIDGSLSNDIWVEFDFLAASSFSRAPTDTYQSPSVDSVAVRSISSSSAESIWETEGDWDAAQTESDYVVHEAIADESASDVSPGYPSNLGNLEHFWTLHEDSGGTASDEVGSADAALSGVSSYSNTGPFGWDAVEFDGSTTASIEIGELQTFEDNRNTPFTWAVWIQPDAMDGQVLLNENAPMAAISFDAGNSELVFERDGVTRSISLQSSDLDEWNLVFFLSDGSDWWGELYNETNHPNGTSSSTATLNDITYVTITVMDSFEDEDIAEYDVGDTVDYSFVTSPTIDGDVALQANSDFATDEWGDSGGGLPAYFPNGTPGVFYVRRSDNSGVYRQYFASDSVTGEYWYVELDWDNDSVDLIRNADDTKRYDDASISLGAGTWYELVITRDDGSLGGPEGGIHVDIRNYDTNTSLATLFTIATDFASQEGIGWAKGVNTGAGVYYLDYFHQAPGRATAVMGNSVPGTVVESFESETVDAWANSETGLVFPTKSSTTRNTMGAPRYGTYYLDHGSTFEFFDSQPGDGLPAYPGRGDIFHFHFGTDNLAGEQYLYFATTDSNNTYRIVADEGGSEIRLEKRVSSTTTTMDTAAMSYVSTEWYDTRVIWDDGALGGSNNDVTVELYDESETEVATLGPVNMNDSSQQDEAGIGIQSGLGIGSGSHCYDAIYIE